MKLNRRAYSVVIPSELMRMRLVPLLCALDAPSICSTYADVKSGSKVVTYFILSLDSSSRLLSDIVHLMMKSIKTCAFIDERERYCISNSLNFIITLPFDLKYSIGIKLSSTADLSRWQWDMFESMDEIVILICSERRSSSPPLNILFRYYKISC